MKRSLLLLCATLFVVAAPLAPARADDSVPVDFFYDALSPYGDWIYTPNYGYVWQPLASQQPGWSPYADGSWVFTDAGWTWMSNEDFGWITYHYGRWIRLQQNWFWVPGNEWAPAWVSWRQTQNQIGWAPLPPEAAWVPNIGFGGWTDSYYDVGPAYYNFVPFTAFASRTSLRPFILDRNRNFGFYDQSVNITHTRFQQNAMNHIFVGGPDPQRIDGFGGNQVRRLTLRRDDEGFRREWLEHRDGGGRERGGPQQRGMGNPSRIEQDQLVVAAPSIRRDSSHALPSRVREAMQQPEIDRGWRGGAGEKNIDQLREKQRDELARSRPPNLPEKNVQPATSATPPPAFGRTLEPHERVGRGGTAPGPNEPRHPAEEVRPANPVGPNTPPGIPNKKNEVPAGGGTVPQPGMPHREREHRNEGQQPGRRPGENNGPPSGGIPQGRPGFPQVPPGGQPPAVTPPPHREPQAPPSVPQTPNVPPTAPPSVPPNTPPNGPGGHRGFPGQGQGPGRGQGQGQGPGHERQPRQQPPSAPPSAPAVPHPNPTPMPPAQPPPAPVRPLPPQGSNPPPVTPVAPPHVQPPPAPGLVPQGPGGPGRKR